MTPGSLQLFAKLSSFLKEILYNFQSCYGDLSGFMPSGDRQGGCDKQPQTYTAGCRMV